MPTVCRYDRLVSLLVRVTAVLMARDSSFQDCIRKCFGNQFCYSLKYDAKAVEKCSLYYFAAYNCTAQDLVLASTVPYPGGAVTVDCLRCPANGDFSELPRWEWS